MPVDLITPQRAAVKVIREFKWISKSNFATLTSNDVHGDLQPDFALVTGLVARCVTPVFPVNFSSIFG